MLVEFQEFGLGHFCGYCGKVDIEEMGSGLIFRESQTLKANRERESGKGVPKRSKENWGMCIMDTEKREAFKKYKKEVKKYM